MASIDFVLSSLGLTGTGFSYGTGLDHDEKGVARDMYDFLQQVTLHPEADVSRIRTVHHETGSSGCG